MNGGDKKKFEVGKDVWGEAHFTRFVTNLWMDRQEEDWTEKKYEYADSDECLAEKTREGATEKQ